MKKKTDGTAKVKPAKSARRKEGGHRPPLRAGGDTPPLQKTSGRDLQRASIKGTIYMAATMIEQLRLSYTAACHDDPLLAMLLLGRLESAARLKGKLCEIHACLEEGQ